MGAFGVIIGLFQYAGLYIQLNAALTDGRGEADNHISGNVPAEGKQPQSKILPPACFTVALFTEVPHDITTHSGEDVEMACSFRGAGSSSYSLEIQWWYIKDHRDWEEKSPYITNNVLPLEETSKDATKISVVKVAGSNISHKLRLSSVKPTDEGMYECHVIDYSGTVAQHHRVQAYLQVNPERSQGSQDIQHESQGNHPHLPQQSEGRNLKKRSAGNTIDCDESCVF